MDVVGRVDFRIEVPEDAGGVSGMAEKMVIEGQVRWSEGDAVHYGGLEVRRGEEEPWEELGELLADSFVKAQEREEGWRGWFGPADLGRLRITVERVGE